MRDCLFCKIIRGEVPSNKVYEDDETLAFLDIRPVNPGHTLVVPKKHSIDIFEIEGPEWDAVMKTTRIVTHALEKALSPDGVNLSMNNRAGAGQAVFHAHVHVMPRFENDGWKIWIGKQYAEGEATRVAEKIRARLS